MWSRVSKLMCLHILHKAPSSGSFGLSIHQGAISPGLMATNFSLASSDSAVGAVEAAVPSRLLERLPVWTLYRSSAQAIISHPHAHCYRLPYCSTLDIELGAPLSFEDYHYYHDPLRLLYFRPLSMWSCHRLCSVSHHNYH